MKILIFLYLFTNPLFGESFFDFFLNKKSEIKQTQQGPRQWRENIQTEVLKIAKSFEGEFGVYIKDVSSGEVYSFNAETPWYLASSIKLPILIAVMEKIHSGKLKLNQKIQINTEDYRDGAGQTNWVPVRKTVTLKFLIEQMMIYSDNAATDKIISLVGIKNINSTLQSIIPKGFYQITSLLEVRHQVYSHIHKKSSSLSNMDYFKIKAAKRFSEKIEVFRKLAQLRRSQLYTTDLSLAFNTYYSSYLNHSTLSSYAQLLEKLVHGQIISKKFSREILKLMTRCQTGKTRIKKHFPKYIHFAHKTGTQYKRACDMGVVSWKQNTKNVIITACTKNYRRLSNSDYVFARLGEALFKSRLIPNVK